MGSVAPAVAGSLITYATGALAANGSGSAVATGGTTSYLYANTGSQTTNTPTAVSFGTITINGTPSYIHTTNIIPAVASTVTFATGATGPNGSGASIATGAFLSSYLATTNQSLTLATTVATGVMNLSTAGTIPAGYKLSIASTPDAYTSIAFIAALDSTTGQESAHTHSYSKTTSISVSAPTASALTSVTLVPAS